MMQNHWLKCSIIQMTVATLKCMELSAPKQPDPSATTIRYNKDHKCVWVWVCDECECEYKDKISVDRQAFLWLFFLQILIYRPIFCHTSPPSISKIQFSHTYTSPHTIFIHYYTFDIFILGCCKMSVSFHIVLL